MSDAGGTPHPIGPPDRGQRFAFYRRRHRRELRRLQNTALAWGAVLGAFVAFLLLSVGGPGTGASIALSAIAGAVLAGLLWTQRLDAYDRLMTAERELGELPVFDDLSFHWAGPADVAELDAAIDQRVVEANHWTAQDRTDFLLSAYIPGVVAGSFDWVVRDRQTGELIGSTTCSDDQLEWGVVSIGIWLTADQRGRGRGTEVLERAVPTVIAFLRSFGPAFSGDSDQVTLSTDVTNTAMLRTADRAGGTQVGMYEHEFADGTIATAVRYRFRADGAEAATGAPTLAQVRRERRHRTEPLLIVTAAVVLLLAGWISWSNRQDARDEHRRDATNDLMTARIDTADLDALQQRLLHTRDAIEAIDQGSFDPVPPMPTSTTLPEPSFVRTLDEGTVDGAEYEVTWRHDAVDDHVRVTVRHPGDDASDSISDLGFVGEIESVIVPLGDGSYVLAWVPSTTEAVIYEGKDGTPVAVAPIDLTTQGADAGTPLLVALPVPHPAAGATLTAIDSRGQRTEHRLS